MVSAKSIRGGDESQRDLRVKNHNRIIGGDVASVGRYSYTVSLQDDIGHFCGGSLIAKDVVLTAAHCAGGKYDIAINRHDVGKSSGEVIRMSKEIKHGKYDDWTTNNDFMLVILDRPTTQDVELVKLNSDKNTPNVGDAVTVMGWGDTVAADDISRLSDVLRDVEVNVISNQECGQSEGTVGGWYDTYDGQITSSMLCAKDNNEDSCQGDSGGPLVIRGNDKSGADDVQVGVVSWGIGCASKDFPGVYARVSVAYDWIKEEVCNRSSDPPASFGCGGSNPSNLAPTPSQPSQPSQPSKPNPSPPSPSPPSPSQPSGDSSNGKWNRIVDEDFVAGFGFFNSGGSDAKHYKSVKQRTGVVRIQDGSGEASSVYSNKISLDGSYSAIKVTFSFYLLSMEDDDEFCLEYSENEQSIWKEAQCWSGRDDLWNKVWYDNTSIELDAKNAESMRIRFLCKGDDNKDDVLIDNVEVEGV